jgi:cytochrome c biogenesis factor
MKTYKVCVQEYVEQIATVEVEAATAREARQKVRDMRSTRWQEFQWKEGDDATGWDIYAVLNSNDETVWER